MQRQVVLAALLASTNAQKKPLVMPDCNPDLKNTDLTMKLAASQQKAADAAITDLKAKKVAQEKLVAAELLLKDAAAKALKTWNTAVDGLAKQGTAGAAAKKDRETKLADATTKRAAMDVADTGALAKAKKATQTAQTAVDDQKKLCVTAKANWDRLEVAVTEHTKENDAAVTALSSAATAFNTASGLSEGAKTAWDNATNAKTKGLPKILDVVSGLPVAMKKTTTNLADTAVAADAASLGTDQGATTYQANYVAHSTKGYTKLLTNAKTTVDTNGSDGKYTTWKNAVTALEKAEQLYDKLNQACASSKGMLGTASGDYQKTCTKFMSGYAEWNKQKTALGTKGTAAVAGVTAVTAVKQIGDMLWVDSDGTNNKVKAGAEGALTDNKTGYAKGVTVFNAVAKVDGTAAYKTRDDAFVAWRTGADGTAVAQKNETLAKLEKSKLDCLALNKLTSAVVAGDNCTLNGVTYTTQVQKIADALADRNTKGTATGGETSAKVNATPWVVAAIPVTGTGMLSGKEVKDNVISDAQITAASGALKVWMQAKRNNDVSAEHKSQATLDAAAAKKSSQAVDAKLVELQATLSVKKYLQKAEQDKADPLDKAKALYADSTELKTHREEEATKAAASATLAAEAVKPYQEDADTTAAAWTLAKSKVTDIDTLIAAQTKAKTAAAAALKVAVSNCKAAGYKAAQDALVALSAKQTTDKAAYATLEKNYVAFKIKKPVEADVTAGKPMAVGVDCSIVVKDGVAQARPVCAEGLCCGAASKFLRDGTKLSIETCQTATDLTYTYYPPLPAATVKPITTKEPASETWRFVCISGAKSLAATATAALAAAYVLA